MTKDLNEFSRRVGEQEARKLKAQSKATETVWFGLGMFGIIGWSIVVPTLMGTALGIWLDKKSPGPHSWTLALLVAGLILGCANAWLWITKEGREMDADTPKEVANGKRHTD